MKLKGISIAAICLAAILPAGAIEEHLTLFPGGSQAGQGQSQIGVWTSDGAVLRKGFKGRQDYTAADQAYPASDSNDLLAHFDEDSPADASGNWTVQAGPDFSINRSIEALGSGSASFRGPSSALSFSPGPASVFGRGSSFRDFTIEFWLYPANVDNGEVLLFWRSLRKYPSGTLPQQIACVVAGGRLQWSFQGFFARPGAAKAADADFRVELRGRSPLIPRVWSHHLIRFNGDTGLLEYLVGDQPEAETYTTASGHEGGTIYVPTIGAAAPLKFCPEYSGLADELRITRGFVEEPSLRAYGQDPAMLLSPIADLGYGNSRLKKVDAEYKAPGTASVEFSYRIADSWAAWRAIDAGREEAWTPFRPGQELPESTRGRYVQLRVLLYPDGSGKLTPSLSSITLRYEPDPPPPPPAALVAYPKNGAVELHWKRVPAEDVAGYLVYYGERPGEYFGTGADQGPSPIDVGNTTTLTLTGIPNGKLLYFVVAAYDSAPDPEAGLPGVSVSSPSGDTRRAQSRAGEFSPETSARPSRTAE